MDGEAFAAYIAQVLVPELAPGTVVILDNLAMHKRCRGQSHARCRLLVSLLALQPGLEPD